MIDLEKCIYKIDSLSPDELNEILKKAAIESGIKLTSNPNEGIDFNELLKGDTE